MNNTVRKIFVSSEISKNEAKKRHIKTINDIINYTLNHDAYPNYGKDFKLNDEMAKEKADMSFNSSSKIEIFTSDGVKFLRISFTCLEYFNEDNFIDGCDYDDFAEFSEEDKKIFFDFIS